jgi:hypothetical protein
MLSKQLGIILQESNRYVKDGLYSPKLLRSPNFCNTLTCMSTSSYESAFWNAIEGIGIISYAARWTRDDLGLLASAAQCVQEMVPPLDAMASYAVREDYQALIAQALAAVAQDLAPELGATLSCIVDPRESPDQLNGVAYIIHSDATRSPVRVIFQYGVGDQPGLALQLDVLPPEQPAAGSNDSEAGNS